MAGLCSCRGAEVGLDQASFVFNCLHASVDLGRSLKGLWAALSALFAGDWSLVDCKKVTVCTARGSTSRRVLP
jgi:hypothetical protein